MVQNSLEMIFLNKSVVIQDFLFAVQYTDKVLLFGFLIA